MIKQKIVEQQSQEDDVLTFRIEPPVVLVTPAEVAPEEAVGDGTLVVPLGSKDGPPRKEPMQVLKIRVPTSTHAQVVALMEIFGCVNESQIYRHVLHVGLKHTKRPK